MIRGPFSPCIVLVDIFSDWYRKLGDNRFVLIKALDRSALFYHCIEQMVEFLSFNLTLASLVTYLIWIRKGYILAIDIVVL